MSDPYTFLFTDVEGSTKLWDQIPELASRLIADQDQAIRAAIARHGGRVFATGGDGVAVVFSGPSQAVTAAVEAQRALHLKPEGVAVRMGLHVGPVIERGNDYFGTTVNRAARLMAAAHGGQVLVSEAVARQVGPDAFSLRDLGIHALRDLAEPEHIYQVCHPELGERFPPLRTLGSYRNNLPSGLAELLGRDRDLEAVAELIATRRSVTVVGPGGVGKTRFVLQVAADVLDRYPGGVWLVELAPVGPQADVAGAVVSAMQLTATDEREDLDRVSEHIGQQVMLLVLDNCEHLIGHVATLVLHLLNQCPQLTVIATSRERMHLREERVYDLAPLETPSAWADSATVATNAAIYLLRQRAQEAGAQDPLLADLQATVSVSRRLDGLPLAIELAASRLRMMSITELDASLAASLRLLATRSVDGPAHHLTMTATIDWSYQLLDDEVKEAFALLSVFLGGFDLAAATVVGDFGSLDDAAESLSFLVESSLLQHVSQGQLSRYRMLEPIRQYALVLLGASEAQMNATRARHAHYFRHLAIEAEPHLFGFGQTEWLGRLDRDIDNLRAAQEWLEHSDRTGLLDFAAAMAGYWFHRARFKEGRAALESALSTPSAHGIRRVDGLIGMAQLCWVGSDYRTAANAASEALELTNQLGDEPRATIAKECLARSWLMMGRTAEAAPLLEEVRSEAHRLGMLRWEADASHFLGFVSRQAGNHLLAQQLHQAARAGFEASGDLLSVGFALGAEAVDAWQLGQLDLARNLATESIRIHEQFGETRGAAEGRSVEAMFELGEGNLGAAYELLLQALNELRDIGSRRGVAVNLTLLARVKRANGSPRLGAVLIGIAEAIFGRDIDGLPPFVTAGIVSTLERELGVDFQPALNEGRAIRWDSLDQWLEQNLGTKPQRQAGSVDA